MHLGLLSTLFSTHDSLDVNGNEFKIGENDGHNLTNSTSIKDDEKHQNRHNVNVKDSTSIKDDEKHHNRCNMNMKGST